MTTVRNYSPEEAHKRFESLPEDVKDAIYGAEMEEALASIGKEHQLHIDQLSILESEVTAVMLGFTDPGDFSGVITERLGISKEKAEKMTTELNASLFNKIRSLLKKGAAEERVPPQSVVSPTPAPSIQPAKEEVGDVYKAADRTLHETTASVPQKTDIDLASKAPVASPSAKPLYKVDPYREPVE